jgi:hypothetical protein
LRVVNKVTKEVYFTGRSLVNNYANNPIKIMFTINLSF